MIRTKPSLSKPIQNKSAKKQPKGDQENVKPGFNTRGYFDPSLPYDEQYLKVKQRVFQKYRNKQEQIIMIDTKNSVKSALIQRGLLIPINNSEQQRNYDSLGNKLLKNYLQRKQKKQMIQNQRLKEIPKINEALSIRNSTVNSRGGYSRQLSSRLSTNSISKNDDFVLY